MIPGKPLNLLENIGTCLLKRAVLNQYKESVC